MTINQRTLTFFLYQNVKTKSRRFVLYNFQPQTIAIQLAKAALKIRFVCPNRKQGKPKNGGETEKGIN